MAAGAKVTLSDEVVTIFESSQKSLDNLQKGIKKASGVSAVVVRDDGAQQILRAITILLGSLKNGPSGVDPKCEMSADAARVMTAVIAPALAQVVVELTGLWSSVETAIENGDNSMLLLNSYLEDAATNTDSSAVRLRAGFLEIHGIVLREMVRNVLKAAYNHHGNLGPDMIQEVIDKLP